jgi:carboxymethylenebutenolidase
MDWFAPGIDATGRRLIVPHVGIVSFVNGRISSEHIYWDQATVLMQLGLLNESLPVIGGTQCARLLDRNAPVNELIERGVRGP